MAKSRSHQTLWRATTYLGVASNAGYFGVASIVIPIALVDKGFDKFEIAAYFAVGSVSAGIVNSVIGPALRRSGFPWWSILIPTGCGVLGGVGLTVVDSIWPALLLSVTLGSLTLVFPFFIGLSSARDKEHGAGVVGNLRTAFVSGYVTGLAAYGLLQLTGAGSGGTAALWLAVAFVGVNLPCSFGLRRLVPVAAAEDAPAPSGTRSDARAWAVVLATVIVLGAMFAAGYQSVGVVYLSDMIRGGLAAGASVFVVLVQVGAILGVGLPLLAPGYSNWIFVIAVGLCVACGVLVLATVAARHLRAVASHRSAA